MIAEGDRVLVGVSGGMDSMSLLDLLNTLMVTVPPFSLIAVNIDPGFDPSYAGHDMQQGYLREGAYDYVMEKCENRLSTGADRWPMSTDACGGGMAASRKEWKDRSNRGKEGNRGKTDLPEQAGQDELLHRGDL